MWISHLERPLKVEELFYQLVVEGVTTGPDVHNLPPIRISLSYTLGLVTMHEQVSRLEALYFALQEYLLAPPLPS